MSPPPDNHTAPATGAPAPAAPVAPAARVVAETPTTEGAPAQLLSRTSAQAPRPATGWKGLLVCAAILLVSAVAATIFAAASVAVELAPFSAVAAAAERGMLTQVTIYRDVLKLSLVGGQPGEEVLVQLPTGGDVVARVATSAPQVTIVRLADRDALPGLWKAVVLWLLAFAVVLTALTVMAMTAVILLRPPMIQSRKASHT